MNQMRIPYTDLKPAITPFFRLNKALAGAGIDARLLELIRSRASQLNGCAYCLDIHVKDARVAGESDERLHQLAAWRESPFFDERERAALALTEAVTLLPSGVSDEVLEGCEAVFSTDEVVALLFAVVEINAWNRLNVASRRPIEVGTADDRSLDDDQRVVA